MSYTLTPRMLQALEEWLRAYHRLLMGGGCKGWQLEEAIVKSIQSDTNAQHNVYWKEAGADDKADITVTVQGVKHLLQIKTGQVSGNFLKLSGHRLGRFKGNLDEISHYLNGRNYAIISAAYKRLDNNEGRFHKYELRYIDPRIMGALDPDGWQRVGNAGALEQVNRFGVTVALRPSMSWQVWWTIPLNLVPAIKTMMIG